MKKHQKIITIFLTLLMIFNLNVALASTESSGFLIVDRLKGVGDAAGYENTTNASLPYRIGSVIKVFLSLLGIIFMSYMLYAGWLWMTARGEEEKIKKAKAIIRGSIIGLVIALGAYAITAGIVTRLDKLK